LTLTGPLFGAKPVHFRDDLQRLARETVLRYAAIKPRAEELKYRQIPWLTDLPEAVRLAKKEKRPLFLWVSQDEPLERC
jgi:hypothetical protein